MRFASRIVLMFAGILCLATLSFGLVLLGATQARKNFERTDLAHHAFESHLALTSNVYQLFKQFADAMLIGDLDRGAMEAELEAEIRKDLTRIREGIAAGIRGSAITGTEELENLARIESKIGKLLNEYQQVIQSNPVDARSVDPRLIHVLDERVDQDFARLIRAALDRQSGELLYQRRANQQQLRFTETLAIWVALGGMLISLSALWWLIRGFQRPVNQLIDGAESLARGERHMPIRLDGGGELDGVAGALNRMVADIAQRQNDLEIAKTRLESAVAARTSELETLLESLRASEASRRQLLADVSHELRAPLAEIRGESEIALRGVDKPTAEYKEALSRCHDASVRTSMIVDDLLFMARQEAGRARLDRSPLDLKDFVADLADACPRSGSDESAVNVRLELRSATMMADGRALRRAFVLMFDHLVRSGANWLGLLLARTPSGVAIVVQAEASGLSAGSLEYSFRHVSPAQAPETGADSLPGLGLPVALAIVEAHGGRVRVESGPSSGVSIAVDLPAQVID
jgi:two-component system, OmpR family, sensor kinase